MSTKQKLFIKKGNDNKQKNEISKADKKGYLGLTKMQKDFFDNEFTRIIQDKALQLLLMKKFLVQEKWYWNLQVKKHCH